MNITCLLLFSYICLIVVMIITLSISFSYLNNSAFKFIPNLLENWGKGPILSINPINKIDSSDAQGDDNLCFNKSTDKKLVPLISTKFPGSILGCLISNTYILPRSCYMKNSVRKGGIPIKRIDSFRYYNWKEKALCGTRLNNNYLDYTVVDSINSCPLNKIPCGVIDSFNNYLCVGKNQDCPINKILIIHQTDKQPTDFKYVKVELSDEYLLLYTNENIKGNIFTELTLSEKQPCYDLEYNNLTNHNYSLIKYMSKECNKITDFRTNNIIDDGEDHNQIEIDRDSLENVNNYNNINNDLYKLPLYQSKNDFESHIKKQDIERTPSQSVTVGLYGKNYYEIDKKCVDKFILQTKIDINYLKSEYFVKNSTSTSSLIILFLFLINLGLTIKLYYEMIFNEGWFEKWNIIIMVFCAFITLLCFINCIIKIKFSISNYIVLVDNNCFSIQATNLIKVCIEKTKSFISLCYLNLLFSLIYFIFPFCFVHYLKINGLEEYHLKLHLFFTRNRVNSYGLMNQVAENRILNNQ